jgi:hypothetical protein
LQNHQVKHAGFCQKPLGLFNPAVCKLKVALAEQPELVNILQRHPAEGVLVAVWRGRLLFPSHFTLFLVHHHSFCLRAKCQNVIYVTLQFIGVLVLCEEVFERAVIGVLDEACLHLVGQVGHE